MKRVLVLPLLTRKWQLFKEGVRLYQLSEAKCLNEEINQ